MRITIEGKGLNDPRERVLAVEAAAESICRTANVDPADAIMMLLTAAVHLASRHSNAPASVLITELAHALGSAAVAADDFFKLRAALSKGGSNA